MISKYRNGGLTPALGRPVISYVEGSVVGGGSEVNSGLYHRLPETIANMWIKENKIENYNLESYYDQVEKDIFVSKMPISASKNSLVLKEGSRKLGWKCQETPRWFKYNDEIKDGNLGTKKSMSETLIPRALSAGTILKSNTKALKIKKIGSKWAIEVIEEGKPQIYTCKNLFICCGAIHTSFLLKSSGLKLRGNTLSLHPSIKITAKFSEKVSNPQIPVAVHQVKEFSPDISFGCSVSTPSYLALSLLDHPKEIQSYLNTWQNYASYYAMITPKGRGAIQKLPFFNEPFVSYKLQDEDYKNLNIALKKLALLLLEGGATSQYPSIKNAPIIKSKKDINKIDDAFKVSNLGLMTIHLMSSIPMGEANHCQIDSWGKVKGYSGLYINDASGLGGPCSVNPQGTIMAQAYRNIFHFLGEN
jgi:hypothetical protein